MENQNTEIKTDGTRKKLKLRIRRISIIGKTISKNQIQQKQMEHGKG
jgi:hypothetical protein